MQIFDVSLSSVKNILNIRRGAKTFFASLKLNLGSAVLGVLYIGMLNRSRQKNQTLDFIGMPQKILDYSLNLSSLFIPYMDCSILKYQIYSSQGESEEEPKHEQI